MQPLFEPKTLVLPIDEAVVCVEQEYGDILEPAEPGIYTRFGYKPQTFFQEHHGVQVEVTRMEQLDPTQPVRGESGIIITPIQLRSDYRPIAERPAYMPSAIKLVRNFLVARLDGCLQWPQNKMHIDEIVLHQLRPEYRHPTTDALLRMEERLISLLIEPISILERFVGDRTWNIFNTQIRGLNLIVDDCGDYRIAEWTRLKAEGRI